MIAMIDGFWWRRAQQERRRRRPRPASDAPWRGEAELLFVSL